MTKPKPRHRTRVVRSVYIWRAPGTPRRVIRLRPVTWIIVEEIDRGELGDAGGPCTTSAGLPKGWRRIAALRRTR